jgi:hypothetical protein
MIYCCKGATISVNNFWVVEMAIFKSDSKINRQANELLSQLRESESARKKLLANLAEANRKIAELENNLAIKEAKLNEALRAVTKARKRQKNSVERANRFKAKLGKSVSLSRL